MTDFDTLKQRFEQERWRGANAMDEELFVHGFLPTPDLLDSWGAARVQIIEAPDWPRTVESIWQQSPEDRDRLLRLDVFECDSRENAHDFLIRFLGNFQSPLIERVEGTPFGDVTFAGPNQTFAVFARANLVVALRNAGPEVIPAAEFAYQVDAELISRPQEGGVAAPSVERFEIPRAEQDRVELQVRVSDPLDLPVWLKLFTRGGAVAREKGALVLRPRAREEIQVTLFAINANRGVASATVGFSEGTGSSEPVH